MREPRCLSITRSPGARHALLAAAAAGALAVACSGQPYGRGSDPGGDPARSGSPSGVVEGSLSTAFPVSENRQFDILFVVDRSGSMATKVASLARNFRSLVASLRGPDGAPFDYRIAVTTSDLGAAGQIVDDSHFNVCNDLSPEGDAGGLSTGPRLAAEDWERSTTALFACGEPGVGLPPGDNELCRVLTTTRAGLATDCQGLGLDAARPFIENRPGLDRSDDEVARQFRCIASVGVNGCFIEQPLEAARVALTRHGAAFLRPGAHLVVVFMTDETDCSVADRNLFDPARRDLAADIGFRCHRDAQRCSGEGRLAVETPDGIVDYHTFSQCEDGPELVPLDDYRRFFAGQIKDPRLGGRVILAGITGDPDYRSAPAAPDGPGPLEPGVVFAYATRGDGVLAGTAIPAPSCGRGLLQASPNPRVHRLLGEFSDPRVGQPSFASICADDFSPALAALGGRMGVESATACASLPASVAGRSVAQSCTLLEQGRDGVRRSAGIMAAEGWSVQPATGTCATSSGQAGVSLSLTAELRSRFAPDSQLRLECPAAL